MVILMEKPKLTVTGMGTVMVKLTVIPKVIY